MTLSLQVSPYQSGVLGHSRVVECLCSSHHTSGTGRRRASEEGQELRLQSVILACNVNNSNIHMSIERRAFSFVDCESVSAVQFQCHAGYLIFRLIFHFHLKYGPCFHQSDVYSDWIIAFVL